MQSHAKFAPARIHTSGRLVALAAIAAVLAPSAIANAATVAYWRMEGDFVTTPSSGTFVRDTNGRTTVTADGILIVDSSGNGNSVYTWDNNATGHQYRPNVPAAIIPQTGAANNWSIQNNGGFPASMTWSKNSLPGGVDVETIKPLAWTVEASIYSTDNTGHRTFVGREGNGVTANTSRAPFYFKTFNGTLGVEFADEAGNFYLLYDTAPIALNTWYNVAAVSDGSTLSLYRDSGAGYQLVNSMSLIAGDTRLAYDDAGSNTAGDTQWGWTLGRGRFGTNDAQSQNHVDRWFGYIDEVRISNSALSVDQFLFSTPIPTPAALPAGLAMLALAMSRRRR